MAESGRIKVGIDYDGVIIRKAKNWDISRRASKMGLPNFPDVIDGINTLRSQPDVDVLGVYTVRPEWLRKKQTDRQIRRRRIPVEQVTHTANSPKAKIEALLVDSFDTGGRVRQVVLIDDSVSEIVQGAKELFEEKPLLRLLGQSFTLAAFNPKQPERLRGMIIPGVVHIVSMQGWSDVDQMLHEVRTLR